MAIRFLLDTNVVSELTKRAPNPAVVRALARHEAECAISAPTLEELAFGCARVASNQRRAWFSQWLDGLVARMAVLPFDAQAALWLGAERARLMKLGRPAPRTDGEIAAVAVVSGLTLVTHNGRDFAAFNNLALADWHQGPSAT
jgi:tRNA(fMet)-specific endonuclease VapC